MKKSSITEIQIGAILKEADAGQKVQDLCRKHEISPATYYKWKSKFDGMSASDMKRNREHEAENLKLKRMYADLSLENDALKILIEKTLKPPERRDTARYLVAEQKMSVSRACAAGGLPRLCWYKEPQNRLACDGEVIDALQDLADRYARWGFWKYRDRLRLDGWPWNHKRIYRTLGTWRKWGSVFLTV